MFRCLDNFKDSNASLWRVETDNISPTSKPLLRKKLILKLIEFFILGWITIPMIVLSNVLFRQSLYILYIGRIKETKHKYNLQKNSWRENSQSWDIKKDFGWSHVSVQQVMLVVIFIIAVIIYRTLASIYLFSNPHTRPIAQILASSSGAMVFLIFSIFSCNENKNNLLLIFLMPFLFLYSPHIFGRANESAERSCVARGI